MIVYGHDMNTSEYRVRPTAVLMPFYIEIYYKLSRQCYKKSTTKNGR